MTNFQSEQKITETGPGKSIFSRLGAIFKTGDLKLILRELVNEGSWATRVLGSKENVKLVDIKNFDYSELANALDSIFRGEAKTIPVELLEQIKEVNIRDILANLWRKSET